MNELTIAERVANGVEWLDAHRPGWSSDIVLARIDLSSGCNCILGQTYGHYFDSPDDARWRDGNSDAYPQDETVYVAEVRGFNGGDDECDDLGDEWRRVITARRETAVDLKARGAVTDA